VWAWILFLYLLEKQKNQEKGHKDCFKGNIGESIEIYQLQVQYGVIEAKD
jgi:hypothetical protein